jgi:hypothetical protein
LGPTPPPQPLTKYQEEIGEKKYETGCYDLARKN